VRKRIAASVGLVAIIMAVVVALSWSSPALPLRVGMTGEEVDAALGQTNYIDWCRNYAGTKDARLNNGMWYNIGPDWRGNFVGLNVYFDNEDPASGQTPRVASWRTHTSPNSFWFQLKYVTGFARK
jgi:hypothetical protein